MSTSMDKFGLPLRYNRTETSVWLEFNQLASIYKPLNLGLGFPDFPPSKMVTDALYTVASSKDPLLHQYTGEFGHPRLVEALSKLYSQLIKKQLNPLTEVLVTHGADGALFSCIGGHVNKGDEVIIIEPYFDFYEHIVKAFGGIPRYIPLKPICSFENNTSETSTSADWILNTEDLTKLFNEKTKAIILNTPHNPLGKVFSLEELTILADLCKQWNVLCISDEVYEWFVCKPKEHVRICTLPGMWERTISIGDAGKTFSVTGWKTGWAYGPENLIKNLRTVHRNCLNTHITPIQEALAIVIEKELIHFGQDICHFQQIQNELKRKRDIMVGILKNSGMIPIIPEGGCFVICDWSPLDKFVDLESESDQYKDFRFVKWMIKNVGLQGIPPTSFCSQKHKSLMEHYVRFCFFKKDETLQRAGEVLDKWKYAYKIKYIL